MTKEKSPCLAIAVHSYSRAFLRNLPGDLKNKNTTRLFSRSENVRRITRWKTLSVSPLSFPLLTVRGLHLHTSEMTVVCVVWLCVRKGRGGCPSVFTFHLAKTWSACTMIGPAMLSTHTTIRFARFGTTCNDADREKQNKLPVCPPPPLEEERLDRAR